MKMQFEAGESIFEEGSPANRFYLILEGAVALESEVKDRGRITIQTLGPGNDLGWSWFFPPYCWRFSARTLEATEAITFDGRALREQANHYLELLTNHTGARAIYILNRSGRVIATSNWQSPDSYLGESDAFRPYYQEAIHGRPSRFFGIGTSRSEPGYYLSRALTDGAHPLGVVVVKISLAQLEQTWTASRELIWVSDANQVIILASRPEWKFTTLGALSPALVRDLYLSRQYNQMKLSPLKIDTLQQLSPTSQIVRWAPQGVIWQKRARWLAATGSSPCW